MAIARVQSDIKADLTGTVNNTTKAYPSNLTAGNLLVCTIATFQNTPGTTITTPTDTRGHTWLPAIAQQDSVDGKSHLRTWYVPNCTAGSNTVTADISGTGVGEVSLVISEWSGAALASPISGTPNAATGTSTTPNSGNTTPADPNCVIYGATYQGGGLITEGSGYTLLHEDTNVGIGTEWKLQGAAAAVAANWTLGPSVEWRCHVIAFKPAVAAATGAAAITETASTAAGAGTVPVAGAGPITDAASTAAGTGAIPVVGVGPITEEASTAAGAGTAPNIGAGAITDADSTATGSGAVAVGGTGEAAETPDISAATGAVALGTVALIQEAADTLAATAQVALAAAANIQEIADTSSATGELPIVGAAAITQDADLGLGTIGKGSVDFNGTTSKVENTTAALGITTQLTICAWVFADGRGESSLGRIFCLDEGANCLGYGHANADNSLRLFVNYSATAGQFTFPTTDGIWNAVALSYDSTLNSNDPVARVNFAPATVTRVVAPVGTITSPNAGYCVGNNTGQTLTWDGMLSNIQVFNRILTAEEMNQALSSPGSVSFGGNLKLWIKMQDAADVNDFSGNAFHGTATALTDRLPGPPLVVSGAMTEVGDTAAGTGVPIVAAITDAADALASAGAVAIAAAANIQEAASTLLAAGAVDTAGQAAILEVADALASAGDAAIAAAGALQDAGDTAAGVGAVVPGLSGAAAMVDAPDTASGTGTVTAGLSGSAAIIQDPDTATGAGAVSITAVGDSVSAPDTLSATGAAGGADSTGAGAVTDAPSILAATAQAAIAASAMITESASILVAAATGGIVGVGGIADAPDTLGEPAVEAPDTATGTGKVSVTGSGAVVQGPDVSAGAGAQPGGALLDFPDVAAGVGKVAVTGTAQILQFPDLSAATGTAPFQALLQSDIKAVAGPVGSTTLAFPVNLTAGSMLFVTQSHVVSGVSTIINTPTDTLGHTYLPVVPEQQIGFRRTRSYYVANCLGGPCTVNFSIGGGTGMMTVFVSEWPGIALTSPISGAPGVFPAVQTTAPNSGNVTPLDDNCLLIAVLDGSQLPLTITPEAEWNTAREFEGAGNLLCLSVVYKRQTALATEDADWTVDNEFWGAHVAAFKPLIAIAEEMQVNSLMMQGHGI